MPYDSDAEDARLLDEGDHARLLAKYEPVVLARCVARLHGSHDAEDVAQDIKLRLWKELQAGKRYGGLPYRVVAHNVIGWTIQEHFQGKDTTVPLPEGWEPSGEDAHDDLVVGSLLDGLPDGTRRVLELRYLEGLEIKEIAARLSIERNAVDQALHRGHEKLREALAGG